MATVIKKISELEQLTDLSSSSNVIIEENGKAKRFSAQNIGKVKTVNGIEPDENGNIEVTAAGMPEINFPVTSVNGMTGDVVIEVGSGGNGVTSWNDLTDKPFYEESFSVDIEWDGEIGERVSIPVGMIEGALLVHVNDQFLPADAFTGLEFTMATYNEDGTIEDLVSTMPSGMMNEVADGVVVATLPYFASVSHDNAEYDGTVFPKAGTYFILVPNGGFIKSLKGESIVFHKIDKKYTDSPVAVNVSYTYNEEAEEYTNITLDLGYDEIVKAYKSGCPVFVCEVVDDEAFRYPATVMCTRYNEMLGSYLYIGLKYTNVEGTELEIKIPHSAIGEEPIMVNFPASSALPEVSADNNGQILGVVDGAWSVMDAPSGLPEVNAGNNGNVLTVVDGEWNAGNINALPAVTAESEGAFLRIVDGVPTWVVLEVAEAGAY